MTNKMKKYKNYKILCEKLKDSRKHNYYYESLFIERLIIEDRVNSILKSLKVANKNRANMSLKEKIKLILTQNNPIINKYLTKQVKNSLIQWDFLFNSFISNVANKVLDEKKIEQLVKNGANLEKKIDLLSKKFK